MARFIDRDAEFLYVPSAQVMAVASATGAIPYDVPGVALTHVGERCSFDTFLSSYKLEDAALQQLALIVRGADTSRLDLTPQSAAAVADAPSPAPSPAAHSPGCRRGWPVNRCGALAVEVVRNSRIHNRH